MLLESDFARKGTKISTTETTFNIQHLFFIKEKRIVSVVECCEFWG